MGKPSNQNGRRAYSKILTARTTGKKLLGRPRLNGSRRFRWAGHVVRLEEGRSAF